MLLLCRFALLNLNLFIPYVALTAAILPCPQSRGSTFDWVPSGTRFYDNLKEWDTYVDNSITDRTTAYFMVMSDDENENLLDDPQRWLNATLLIAEQVRAPTRALGAGTELLVPYCTKLIGSAQPRCALFCICSSMD